MPTTTKQLIRRNLKGLLRKFRTKHERTEQLEIISNFLFDRDFVKWFANYEQSGKELFKIVKHFLKDYDNICYDSYGYAENEYKYLNPDEKEAFFCELYKLHNRYLDAKIKKYYDELCTR